MTATDEAAIRQLMSELVNAWDRGDALGYGASYRPDGTFTNVDGAFFVGHEAFKHRHEEIFRGYLKETTLGLKTRKLRFIRPDVAIVDVDVSVSGMQARPPAVQAGPDGALHTCLLLVLVKEGGSWWIAAYHNVWRSAGG